LERRRGCGADVALGLRRGLPVPPPALPEGAVAVGSGDVLRSIAGVAHTEPVLGCLGARG
jgi:hypothetical protein